MKASEVSRLSDDALRRGLQDLVACDRHTTARLLIHIAEFQSRGLYREAGYDSMFRYCVGELCMSEDVAYKRIRVAARARRLPRILSAIAEGRLSVSAVAVLAPYLRDQNADELLSEAEGKTRAQIEALLASRFPQPDVPTLVRALPNASSALPTSDGRSSISNCQELAPGPIAVPTTAPPLWSEEKPLAPGRYVVRFTIDQEAHDLLERAKALLSHKISSGDEGEVFVHALRALVGQLGAGFMRAKHEGARRAAAKKEAEEVIPWLRAMGIRADRARWAAERCESIPDAPLEERVKAALSCLGARPSNPALYLGAT